MDIQTSSPFILFRDRSCNNNLSFTISGACFLLKDMVVEKFVVFSFIVKIELLQCFLMTFACELHHKIHAV